MDTDPIQQIAIFRVPELQGCLQQLGQSKSGLKRDLQTRLGNHLRALILSAELPAATEHVQRRKRDAVRLVNQMYCRLKGIPENGNTPSVETISTPGYLANGTGFVAERSQPESSSAGGSARGNSQIRCICAQPHDKGTMIQCEDCGVWQHCDCVRVNVLTTTCAHFLCELCRLAKADPFWRRVGAPLVPPMKLVPVQPPRVGFDGRPIEEDVVQVVDRHFQIQHTQLDPVRRHGGTNQLQVACLMLADPVALRVHWPRNADLRMNGMMYKPYGRGQNAKLGANSRDDMASVGIMVTPGRNRLHLSAVDKEHYCVLVHLAQQRTDSEVRDMMHAPETLEEALRRVQQRAGRPKGDADDSDDDLEVCTTEFSLRCPLSGSRIRTPARFAGVGGLTAFDLDTFLGVVKRSKKWQCPHSMRNLPVQDLMLDGYLSRVLPRLQNLPDMMDIEVSPASGEWRVAGSQGAWMSITEDPGSLLDARAAIKPEPQLGSDAPAQGAAGGGDSDSDEELSEGEELRQAAAAAAAHSRKAAAAAQDEIIVLSDSDDDDPPPRPSAPSQRMAAPAPSRAALAYHPAHPAGHSLSQRTLPASMQPSSSSIMARAARVPSHQLSQSGHQQQQQQGARLFTGAPSWPAGEGSAESIPGVGSPQVIQGRGITIRLPGRPSEASPASGSQAQSQQQQQGPRPMPRSLAAASPPHARWQPHPQQPTWPGPSAPVQPWPGGQHSAPMGTAQSFHYPPPMPPSAAMRQVTPGPPPYTNARALAQPLRFGAPPSAALSYPARPSPPQSPEAAAVGRMPVLPGEGSRALEQRFGMHARPAPPSTADGPSMPRVPSPGLFGSGAATSSAAGPPDNNAEYNDWLNMLLTGGPDDQGAPPPPPPQQAQAASAAHRPASTSLAQAVQRAREIVDLDSSSSG